LITIDFVDNGSQNDKIFYELHAEICKAMVAPLQLEIISVKWFLSCTKTRIQVMLAKTELHAAPPISLIILFPSGWRL